MKIAIPTNSTKGIDDEVAVHFGRCPAYTILNEHGEVIEIIQNTSEHMGGKGLPPELIKNREATILLCGDIGPRAIRLCADLGIDIYVCKEKEVRRVFEAWKSGKLKKAGIGDACEEHKV